MLKREEPAFFAAQSELLIAKQCVQRLEIVPAICLSHFASVTM